MSVSLSTHTHGGIWSHPTVVWISRFADFDCSNHKQQQHSRMQWHLKHFWHHYNGLPCKSLRWKLHSQITHPFPKKDSTNMTLDLHLHWKTISHCMQNQQTKLWLGKYHTTLHLYTYLNFSFQRLPPSNPILGQVRLIVPYTYLCSLVGRSCRCKAINLWMSVMSAK